MKTVATKQVKSVLLKLGLKSTKGNGTGHEQWKNANGNKCLPVLRHKEMSMGSLYCLGEQLESNRICTRREFLSAVQTQ